MSLLWVSVSLFYINPSYIPSPSTINFSSAMPVSKIHQGIIQNCNFDLHTSFSAMTSINDTARFDGRILFNWHDEKNFLTDLLEFELGVRSERWSFM